MTRLSSSSSSSYTRPFDSETYTIILASFSVHVGMQERGYTRQQPISLLQVFRRSSKTENCLKNGNNEDRGEFKMQTAVPEGKNFIS